jgi:hypothetical protein
MRTFGRTLTGEVPGQDIERVALKDKAIRAIGITAFTVGVTFAAAATVDALSEMTQLPASTESDQLEVVDHPLAIIGGAVVALGGAVMLNPPNKNPSE